jgi:hypothetical protein
MHSATPATTSLQKAQAIVQRTTVLIVAQVAVSRDELVDQITVGAVQFDAIEPASMALRAAWMYS